MLATEDIQNEKKHASFLISCYHDGGTYMHQWLSTYQQLAQHCPCPVTEHLLSIAFFVAYKPIITYMLQLYKGDKSALLTIAIQNESSVAVEALLETHECNVTLEHVELAIMHNRLWHFRLLLIDAKNKGVNFSSLYLFILTHHIQTKLSFYLHALEILVEQKIQVPIGYITSCAQHKQPMLLHYVLAALDLSYNVQEYEEVMVKLLLTDTPCSKDTEFGLYCVPPNKSYEWITDVIKQFAEQQIQIKQGNIELAKLLLQWKATDRKSRCQDWCNKLSSMWSCLRLKLYAYIQIVTK